MKEIALGELARGQRATIVSVAKDPRDSATCKRLLEMGFLEGSEVEVVQEAPFWHDPVAIRIRGGLIALRRNEANLIQVIVDHGASKESFKELQ